LRQQIGDIAPTAHLQTVRNPRQSHRRLLPDPAGQFHFLGVALGKACPLMVAPPQRLSSYPNHEIAALRGHGGRLNFSFCDGHVEPIKVQDLLLKVSPQFLKRWHFDNQPHMELFPSQGGAGFCAGRNSAGE
jgi:prepilin-type processing-associated H-X9-DG protein